MSKQWTFKFGGISKDWPQVVRGDGPADLIARTYGAGATEHAKLIAAAPDLLAALEAASRMLAEYNAGRLNYPTTTPEVLAESRAAIAKARGVQS